MTRDDLINRIASTMQEDGFTKPFEALEDFEQDNLRAYARSALDAIDEAGCVIRTANTVYEEAAKVADKFAADADVQCFLETDRAKRWHLADRRNFAKEMATAIRAKKTVVNRIQLAAASCVDKTNPQRAIDCTDTPTQNSSQNTKPEVAKAAEDT